MTQLEPGQLAIEITNKTGEFNENNWAKKDFSVSITSNGDSYKWCSSTVGECTPDKIVNNPTGSVEIKNEGTNTVCAVVMNDTNQGEVKCNSFKLDKTKPVITNATVTKTSSNFTVAADLSDSLSSILEIELVSKTTTVHTTSGLPFHYTGKVEASSDNTLTFSVTDEAGNTRFATGTSANDYVSPSTYYASFGLDGSYPICSSGDSQTENEFYYVNIGSTCPSGYTADERYIVTEGRIVCWKDQVLCASCPSGYSYNSGKCSNSGYKLVVE